MLKRIMDIIKGGSKGNGVDIKKNKYNNVEEYLDEVIEVQATPEEDDVVNIKVCKVENDSDAVEALLLVESGNIVIAKIPHLEKEADDEFFEILSKMDDEVRKYEGTLMILGDEFLLLTPKNVRVEKHKSLGEE
ncbi:cell division protein SepF [Methanocaldococcus infernus]